MAEKKKNTSKSNTKLSASKSAVSKKKSSTTNRSKQDVSPIYDTELAELIRDILISLLFLIYLLMFLANLGLLDGALSNFFSGIMFGMMGYLAYLFPIVLGFVTLFAIANAGNKTLRIYIWGGIFFVIFICMLVTLVATKGIVVNPIEAYRTCSKEHNGGGMIGAAICDIFIALLGTVGAYIMAFAFLAVSAMLFYGKAFINDLREKRFTPRNAGSDDEEGFVKASIRKKHKASKKNSIDIPEFIEKPREERPVRRQDRKVGENFTIAKVGPENGEVSPQAAKAPVFEGKVADPLQELREKKQQTGPVVGAVSDDVVEITDRIEVEEEIEEEIIPVIEEAVGEVDTYPEGEEKQVSHRKPKRSAKEVQQGTDEMQLQINLNEQIIEKKEYEYPQVDLLTPVRNKKGGPSNDDLFETAAKLQKTLHDFNVDATVTDYSCGPAVTRFEITPDVGVKVSKIVSLADDLKLNLAVSDIRIEAPIPGKPAVGIEVPNDEASMVSFRELVESSAFASSQSKLSFVLGKDIGGNVKVTDIAKMPHLLIAGATGSGKSVCINTIIMSILYKASPEDVKMIMIDPKVVELSVYNGIPHLLIPVVTDPKKAANALAWAVSEMTDRYNKFAEYHVRDIKGYNNKIERMEFPEGQERPKKLPLLVVIVDELADLMMVASKDVEESICRLAQLARAAGIHLIIATQRPSVNVITGLIKANMPSRIAFAVTSGIDSRTILDMNGAEKLLGKGDMLFSPQGAPKPMRVQGAFVSDEEVAKVTEWVKEHNGFQTLVNPEIEKKLNAIQSGNNTVSISGNEADDGRDPLFADAGKIITDKEKASIGMLQRYLKVGFNRAARIMDQLEDAGVVGPDEGTKPRQVLMSVEDFDNYLEQNG